MYLEVLLYKSKGKAVPLQAWSGTEWHRFHDNGTGWW